jgi:hypothetical protein
MIKKVLERDIENKFVKEVKKLGCKTRKLNGMGYKSWPDRLILCPGGAILFIEFKKPGEGLSELQQSLHSEVAEIGHVFKTYDSWEDAIKYVRTHIKT